MVADMPPGNAINAHQRMKDLMDEIKLEDEVGLDVFALGEHHRPEYAGSAVVLGAAAA